LTVGAVATAFATGTGLAFATAGGSQSVRSDAATSSTASGVSSAVAEAAPSRTTDEITTTSTTATTSTTIPPPITAAPSVGGSSLTSAMEQQVVRTTWKNFATAFATGDTATLAATSTPSVQQVITGTFHCGCGGWPVASTVVNYSAPIEKSYPYYFFAELQGQDFNGQPLMKEVAFSEAGPAQPWLVSYLGSYVNGQPVFGTASSDSVTGAPTPVPEPIDQAPSQFAAWFQQLDQTGTQPPLPSHWIETNVMKEEAAGSLSQYQSDQAYRYTDTYSHSISATSPTFGLPGGQLIFASLGVTRTVTPAAGQVIVQPSDRSPWGQLLAPGNYHQLTLKETIDICLGESQSGSITQLTNLGGPYSVTGS
jgi:hypothetical protein